MEGRECFEVFAIRYGHFAGRKARENFLGNFLGEDPHDSPMPMDFFVWLAKGPRTTWVIDTGYSPEAAARRKRVILKDTSESLRELGVDPATVKNLIVTHLHYDHVGNFALFPAATFHLQDREMSYATGRHMAYSRFRAGYEVDEVVAMVRQVYAGRVRFHDGDVELVPGLSLHRVGGHTDGLQVVRIWTKRGWVVLASDALHYYANMEKAPFPDVFHVGDMMEGFTRMRELADSDAHIVPGHDPLVLTRYPAVSPEHAGMIVRLDE
jgi:glyoxylase-like metal-dependent hydrolase (beta-lactamase superfamily II)